MNQSHVLKNICQILLLPFHLNYVVFTIDQVVFEVI